MSEPACGDEPRRPEDARVFIVVAFRGRSLHPHRQARLERNDDAFHGFLRDRITADAGGWVALSLIVSFNRIARMGLSAEEVADALIASKELEVDRDALRVRRQRPLPA